MLEFLKIDLSSNIAVFIIIVMFFFSLFLILKIKRLKVEIENLRYEDKTIFQKRINDVEEDIVSIENISNCSFEKDVKLKSEIQVSKNTHFEKKELLEGSTSNIIKEESLKEEVNVEIENKIENRDKENSKKIVNAVSKNSSVVLVENKNLDVGIERASFNLDEFVRDKEKTNNKVSSSKNDSQDYLREISRKMADELEPQTIELTDYEKDQEENAIISYQELLSVKNSVSALEEGETVDFIEELKKLRNSLN